MLTREDVDHDRIALVGGLDIGGTFLANMGAKAFGAFMRQINDLATLEYRSGEVQYVPAIARDLSEGLAFMPNPEAFSYYDRTSRTDAPTWENRVAVKSVQAYFAYNSVADALTAAQPDIIFVGLGFPKQERLIETLRPLLPRSWFLGIGVSFSFVAGEIKRAPLWVQRVGLEWLHRMLQEPGRLFKRYVIHDLPFALRLFLSIAWKRLT